MPKVKEVAWIAAIALAVLVGVERYKAKAGGAVASAAKRYGA